MADHDPWPKAPSPPSRNAAPPPEPRPSTVDDSPSSDGESISRTPAGTVLMHGAGLHVPKTAQELEGRSSRAGAGTRTPAGTVLMRDAPRERRGSRTTILEVGEVAQRLSTLTRAPAPSAGRQIALSFAVSVTLVLLATMIFAGGAFRVALAVVVGMSGTTLAVWYTLAALPKLAARLGPRELPGTPVLWVGGLLGLAALAAVGATWSVAEVTKPLARFNLPADVPAPAAPSAEQVAAAPAAPRADDGLKRGAHVSMSEGVMYLPPGFESKDGSFDLLIHYHGSVEIVERSIDAAGLNAVAMIVNNGEGSGKYSEPLSNPHAFDESLERIEQRVRERFGLQRPRIRRVALASWSAGFGAVYHVLASRSRLDRVDAVLMMDSLHASYVPGTKNKLTDISLRPFVRFGERAVAGDKLMVITHSAIETVDYPDTTRSASGLLEKLGVARSPAEGVSPPPVDIDVAVRAFPSGERNWMRVVSVAEKGSLTVLGCSGKGKGDHVAHLAQMSVTVLPPLVAWWKRADAVAQQ